MLRVLKAAAASTEPLYDSAARLGPRALLRSVAAHRELVGLLARREVTARYRRALLGMAWTIITPVAYAAALWAVFSQVAPFVTPHALSAMATLAITTLVLFAVQIATDTGIPLSALGLPLAFALLAIATA